MVFGAVIGTGAGGGLVIDRRLQRGRNGLAGEWGHLPIPASLVQRYALPLFPCGCGLTGCYERYVSGPGLLALNQHRGHPADSLPALMARYRAGDPHARDLFIDILACALAGLQMVVDADAFVLGGGLSNISEIYPLLPAAMGRWLFPGARNAARLW
ncbi:N-acetyl-D-glucosamine kinase [Sodalis praecaptivus]|nr:N-acetyl-D-glucosamine kinase [Sodalis praecaptivus]